MNDPFTDLEQELKELAPDRPDNAFETRLAKALGPQGDIAVRNFLQTSEKTVPFRVVRNWAVAAGFVLLLGIAAASFYLQKRLSDELSATPVAEAQKPMASGVAAAPVQTVALEADFPHPGGNWRVQDRESILVEVRDEGVIDEPLGSPAQQFRYRYFDTATFTDPIDNSRMRMTVPREQVVLVKLKPH